MVPEILVHNDGGARGGLLSFGEELRVGVYAFGQAARLRRGEVLRRPAIPSAGRQ